MNRLRGSACVWPIVHSVGACSPRSTIRAGRGLASGASTPSPAAGWRTEWRVLARAARERGYVPIDARLLESFVTRRDGRRTSWLALLDGCALLVHHERADWRLAERQSLARLVVRLGGLDAPGAIVVDVVRRGRTRRATYSLDPFEPDALASALWLVA